MKKKLSERENANVEEDSEEYLLNWFGFSSLFKQVFPITLCSKFRLSDENPSRLHFLIKKMWLIV